MKENGRGLLGIFCYLDDVLRALRRLKELNIQVHTVYSPARCDEIMEALEIKPSPVRFFTLAGGVLGVIAGFALSIYTAVQWRFVVSGKPPVPLIPYVIEGFEVCILLSVFLNLAGIFLLTGMPRFRLPGHYDARFSEDRYGIVAFCPDGRETELSGLLKEAGAEEIHDVRP